jgi:hypothetical protein
MTPPGKPEGDVITTCAFKVAALMLLQAAGHHPPSGAVFEILKARYQPTLVKH